jgi:hypothetical protein
MGLSFRVQSAGFMAECVRFGVETEGLRVESRFHTYSPHQPLASEEGTSPKVFRTSA